MRFSTSLRIRLSPEHKALAHKRALHAGTTVSDLLRRMIEEGAPLAPACARIDEQVAPRRQSRRKKEEDPVRAELRRIGGLLKHLAPGNKPWATWEDKRRWWQAVENIEALGRGRRPPHQIEWTN